MKHTLSKSDEGALRPTSAAPPVFSRPHRPILISSGILLGMLMESYHVKISLGIWGAQPRDASNVCVINCQHKVTFTIFRFQSF